MTQFPGNLTISSSKRLKNIYKNTKMWSIREPKIHNVWHSIRDLKAYKEAWEKKPNGEKEAMKTDPEMTQVVELVHKYIKMVILTGFPMFEILKKRLIVWDRDAKVTGKYPN